MASPTLRFITWNTRGVVSKLNFILKELKKQHAEIVFLQETHIGSKNYYKTLNQIAGWKCFFTVFDTQSKGVAILIKDDVKFEYICHDEDYSGGYLVLFCYIHGELFTLVNVYNHKHDNDILNRLQHYLRETAEGVLVVGGDFNTVLDLTLDQKKETGHTPLRGVFEKFTTSLNLMDTWVHLHPTEKAFTRSQKDSFSRLDMILMPEDIIERVSDVTMHVTKLIPKSNGKMKKISDHDPVVLSLTCSQFSKELPEFPKVASLLKDHAYSRDKKAGKINGAEILSVINSLTDCRQVYPYGEKIQTFKTQRCELTETTKKLFNKWLDNGRIDDEYNQYTCTTGTRKIFTVNYLIFTMILAKRLTMLLLDPPNKKQPNTDCYIVTLVNPVRIRRTFLKNILSDLCKNWKDTKKNQHKPQSDFRILEALRLDKDLGILGKILTSEDNSSTNDDIELQEGCPLTRSIRSLVMKWLEIRIKEKGYETHTCQFRQVVVINFLPGQEQILKILKNFCKKEIKLNISKIIKS